METEQTGTLYVVATPIGNLGDASSRTKEMLGSVHRIACEDTRVTGSLLAHLDIPKPSLVSYREENEASRAEELLEDLRKGYDIALVADAGTPAVSDPGFRLVRACRKAQLPVVPIPGPNAAVVALSASGLPSDRFYFIGFLPPKSAGRKRFLKDHHSFPSTLIVYESVHRIEKFLNEIVEELGPDRIISVARELTKKFETSFTGSASTVRTQVQNRARKGEFVVLIAPESFEL